MYMGIHEGELEEASAELETSRRKLAALRSQKEDMFVGPPTPGAMQPGVKFEFGDGIAGPEKASREARELEASLEEAKVILVFNLSSHWYMLMKMLHSQEPADLLCSFVGAGMLNMYTDDTSICEN